MKAGSSEGTQAYVSTCARSGVPREHFRRAQDLWVSSIGIGTYRGDHDDATDALYRRAVVRAAESGFNMIDTAINYRCQRSERAIGKALQDLEAKGIGREQVVVATKGGFIPFDGEPPLDVEEYKQQTFYSNGVLAPSDVVDEVHAMTPRYLEHQIERSLGNLGIETIDVYYLHNPETQLGQVSRDELAGRLRSAFECLEKVAGEGKIRFYGAATWNSFRQPPGGRDYLCLEEVVGLARDVAGDNHRFRFIQLPFSLAMTEALSEQSQPVLGNLLSALLAAGELGVTVVSSASIGQGRLTRGLPRWLGKLFKGLITDAQRSLQFARSAPGVTTALVGMKDPGHVEENVAVAKVPPAAVEDFLKLFEVDQRD